LALGEIASLLSTLLDTLSLVNPTPPSNVGMMKVWARMFKTWKIFLKKIDRPLLALSTKELIQYS